MKLNQASYGLCVGFVQPRWISNIQKIFEINHAAQMINLGGLSFH